MLALITWSEYGVIIAIILAVYYTVLVILFYKNEILAIALKKQEQQQKENISSRDSGLGPSDKHLDTFFHNRIAHNENREFQNSFNHQDDSEKDGRDELINKAEFTTNQQQPSQPELFTSHQKYTPAVQETDDTLQQVQELTARLKEAIEQGVNKNYIKEEFILSLRSILKKYYFLKGSPFLVLLDSMIASECEKYGYIQLSAEERVMLWNE